MSPRVPVGYPASIQSDPGAGEGILHDLSPTGCRMRSYIALNAGAYLVIRARLAEKREGSEVSSSRVTPVPHVLPVSLTIHERRKSAYQNSHGTFFTIPKTAVGPDGPTASFRAVWRPRNTIA
jgi:hypothetical protein